LTNTAVREWVTIRPLALMASYLVSHGQNWQQAVDRFHLDPDPLTNDDAKIDIRRAIEVMEYGAWLVGNDALAFDMFADPPLGYGSSYDYIALSAPTFRDSLRNWERFYPIRSNCISLSYEEHENEGRLTWDLPTHFGKSTQLTYAFVAWTVARIERIVGAEVRKLSIDLAVPAPNGHSSFADRYRNVLQFNRPVTRIRIPVSLLDIRPKTAEPNLFSIVETAALKELEECHPVTSGSAVIAAEIGHQLKSGRCSMESVAAALGTSTRSLQRTLENEGTTYRKVLEAVRKSMAARYLSDTDMPIKEIAYLLGFSEISAFSRAVKGWFGHPPRTVRQNNRGPRTLASAGGGLL